MTESQHLYEGKIISCSEHIFEIMSKILNQKEPIDKDREHAWVICLNSVNSVINIELISKGTTSETIVTPREVFCQAIRKRATQIILVHNHPSSMCLPSYADISITEELIQIGKLISIPVIEHIILSADNYFSFADLDLIDILDEDPFRRTAMSEKIEKKERLYRKLLDNLAKKRFNNSPFGIF